MPDQNVRSPVDSDWRDVLTQYLNDKRTGQVTIDVKEGLVMRVNITEPFWKRRAPIADGKDKRVD